MLYQHGSKECPVLKPRNLHHPQLQLKCVHDVLHEVLRIGSLLPDFLDAAAELVSLGAEAITTNCGFLSLFQQELAAHVRVPVATSSLIQVPWVQATLPPGKRVGVVTVSGSSLTARHFQAAGAPADTPFVGTEDGDAGQIGEVLGEGRRN